MNNFYLLPLLFICGSFPLIGQGITKQTYHDLGKKNLKEVYQVKDTIRNVLHGRYISYFLNGNIESKGQFTNNETTGVWEFYYETGSLKMRGVLKQNANFGVWEYFYESGEKSMEGSINGKDREGEWKSYYENGQIKEIGEYVKNKRDGLWKSYFEDGVLKGEVEYKADHGRYIEYYHSGKVYAEGPKVGTRAAGRWRYFAEDGTLQSEGDYSNGRKQGEWVNYFPNATIASKGKYENDIPVGPWEYYFNNGALASSGNFVNGKKDGAWKTMNENGTVKEEASFNNGTGVFTEYYASGKPKAKGRVVNDKKEGLWEYYYEDGKREGQCEFHNGKGVYYGYFPNGNLQTKGELQGDTKVGTWEIYEKDGKLAGYYRPFYDDKQKSKDILDAVKKTKQPKFNSHALGYFDARFNEFRGVILASNPLMAFAGELPIGIEFYLEERLGHEFEFIGIRKPFFQLDGDITPGKRFERGYAIAVKQKLYNELKTGMWYFGHEVRFTNNGHFVNELVNNAAMDVFTFSAVEQRIEYGPLVGFRLMKRNDSKGFTVDAYASANIGYRGFDVDPAFSEHFHSVGQSRISTSFHFGLNFGHVFSFQ